MFTAIPVPDTEIGGLGLRARALLSRVRE